MSGYMIKDITVMNYSPMRRIGNIIGRPMSSFLFVDEGKYMYEYESTVFFAEQGDAVYLPEGGVYKYTVVSDKTRATQAEFKLSDGKRNLCFSDFPVLVKNDGDLLKSCFADMLKFCHNDELSVASAILKLLSLVSGKKRSGGMNKIEAAVRFIQENPTEKIFVSELADLCEMSESHLRRLFSEFLGMSPIEYKNSLILKSACSMLSFDRLNVSETADALGFGDIYTFSQFFKKRMGLSPKKYSERVSRG